MRIIVSSYGGSQYYKEWWANFDSAHCDWIPGHYIEHINSSEDFPFELTYENNEWIISYKNKEDLTAFIMRWS